MSRRGLTVIELLIAIGIIGLLCALLAPAIMSARGAARKMECSSHLRQLGLASSNYASTHNCLPPGSINFYSWHVMLLPYVDQETLYRRFNFSIYEMRQFQPGRQNPIWEANIAVFKCPTDPLAWRRDNDVPKHSYHGCSGSGLLQGGFNGLIRLSSIDGCARGFRLGIVRLENIPNGLSNTVMVSERLVGDNSGHLLRNNWSMTSSFSQPNELEAFRAACLNETPRAVAGGGWWGDPVSGHNWWDGGSGSTLYNHMMTPNQQTCHSNAVDYGALTASSLHPGGVNVVYGDGHAAFVSQHVDSVVWTKMGSRVDRDLCSGP